MWARPLAWMVFGALLLGLGWWLGQLRLATIQPPEPVPATADVNQALQDGAVQARIDQRLDRASQCVRQALRGLGLSPSALVPLLVVVSGPGCEHCDSEAEAQRLVDDYRLEGIDVLLIRTVVGDNQPPSPAGVPTIAVAGCAELVAELGDDYLLRRPDGSLDSSGYRHEAWLRRPPTESPDEVPPPPPFDPERALRQALDRL